jgi:hypothetical protein
MNQLRTAVTRDDAVTLDLKLTITSPHIGSLLAAIFSCELLQKRDIQVRLVVLRSEIKIMRVSQ